MFQELKVENIPRPMRLDMYLGSLFPEMTRSTAKKLVMNWLVKRDNYKIRPSSLVQNGDLLNIDLEGIRKFVADNKLAEILPVQMDINIVYEDANTLVVDKPSGMVTHPVYQHYDDTLMNGLTYYIINNSPNPFGRIRPVHRLDKDTSGIILISKNLEAHDFYSKQFKKREVQKTYLALVAGNFKDFLASKGLTAITISDYIGKHPDGYMHRSGHSSLGEYAETEIHFEKLLGGDKYSLLRVLPHTGRTHQIRVHLSELGFPILGDLVYGGMDFPRLMLHAWKLDIDLYSADDKPERKTFTAELPAEFINPT